MRRGLTLVETLVVVGILALLAGLLFPVFKSAKRSAQVAAAVENLRQHQIAASLYRTEHEGDGIFGTASQMGLPLPELAHPGLGLPLSAAISPCTPVPASTRDPYNVAWWPDESEMFRNQALQYREMAVLVSDMNCNEAGVLPENPYQTRLGLAATIEGRLLRRRKGGRSDNPEWWHTP